MLNYRRRDSSKSLLSKLIHKQNKIPLNLFQCWHTLNLPPKMSENVALLKKQNPEFVHYLYDDGMCGEFIRNHFGEELFYIFNKLKPGAYKADLWRYCVLYIHGGIYLDIKYKCTNRFKLTELTDKEYYVKDLEYQLSLPKKAGVYQALMCSFPKNRVLLNCIQTIVYNVKHNLYNNNTLDVTGPHIFDTALLKNTALSFTGNAIVYHTMEILRPYKEYRNEQNTYAKNNYYAVLWNQKNIYEYPTLQSNKSIVLTRTITRSILETDVLFFASTPTLVEYNQQYILQLRWVNYEDIHKKVLPAISLNSMTVLDSSFSPVKEVFLKDSNAEAGLDNIHLFNYQNVLYYNASFYDKDVPATSCSIYPIDNPVELEQKVISFDTNSCPNGSFVLYKEKLCMVYQWYPLKIGEMIENRLDLVETKNMPEYFKEAQSSTPGYSINSEIWFVLHTSQHYVDNGKTYYNYQHFFAVLDKDMNLIRYSELFKLGGCNVEQCLGLIVKEDEILLSYSLMETQSFISFYKKSAVNQLKWYS